MVINPLTNIDFYPHQKESYCGSPPHLFHVASLWKSSSCSKRQLPAGRWQPSGWYLCRYGRCRFNVDVWNNEVLVPCSWINDIFVLHPGGVLKSFITKSNPLVCHLTQNWDGQIWPCFCSHRQKDHWSWIQSVNDRPDRIHLKAVYDTPILSQVLAEDLQLQRNMLVVNSRFKHLQTIPMKAPQTILGPSWFQRARWWGTTAPAYARATGSNVQVLYNCTMSWVLSTQYTCYTTINQVIPYNMYTWRKGSQPPYQCASSIIIWECDLPGPYFSPFSVLTSTSPAREVEQRPGKPVRHFLQCPTSPEAQLPKLKPVDTDQLGYCWIALGPRLHELAYEIFIPRCLQDLASSKSAKICFLQLQSGPVKQHCIVHRPWHSVPMHMEVSMAMGVPQMDGF